MTLLALAVLSLPVVPSMLGFDPRFQFVHEDDEVGALVFTARHDLPGRRALERVPESLLEAAADLGARRWRSLLDVLLPLALPGVVAGSIFTFSLTLGDYITPILVGGAGSSFIGNVAYANIGVAGNVPFAAAVATIPIAIMAVYLLIAKRLGAFEAL